MADRREASLQRWREAEARTGDASQITVGTREEEEKEEEEGRSSAATLDSSWLPDDDAVVLRICSGIGSARWPRDG